MTKQLSAALLFLLSLSVAPAWASNLADFNQAVADSYRHYRAAVFYLRTGNPAVAGFETTEALQLWRETVLPYGTAVPDAFSDDPEFASTLNDIETRLTEADSLLAGGGDAEAANALLLPIRTELGELRARNSVIVFSDHVDAANAAMDLLWAYRHEPPDWADPVAFAEVTGAAALTIFFYEALLEQAPSHIAENPEFQRIMEGSLRSLEGVWQSIQAKDEALVISYLREMRSFDRILWLQFG